VGLAQDATRFSASIGLVDPKGPAATWAIEGGAEKLFGSLATVYFIAGAYQDYTGADKPAAAFDVVGAGGAFVATFGEALGLGSWAGPVGWGVAIAANVFIEAARTGHELRENTEKADEFLKGGGVDEATAKTLSGDALQEATTLQKGLGLNVTQIQELAATHPEISTDPGTAQGIVDAAKTCGISNEDVQGFVDALAKDDPMSYGQLLAQHQLNLGGASPMTQAANLFTFVEGMPNAGAFVRAHSPQLFGPAQDARRQADVLFEETNRSPEAVAGLMAGTKNPAFQSEMIRIMQDSNTLDFFVQKMGTSDAFNSDWVGAAKSAIQAADASGVLSHAQAQGYLAQLG
jgi:hypothetical protein